MGKISVYIVLSLFVLIIYALFFKEFVFMSQGHLVDDIPDFVFHDISILHYTNGQLDLKVSANRAVINQDDSNIVFEQSSGVSFLNDSFFRFNAKQGNMNLDSGSMQLWDTYLVYVYANQFYWLDSKFISWEVSENVVMSPDSIQLSHETFRIVADTMTWDLKSQNVYFNDYPSINLNSSYEN